MKVVTKVIKGQYHDSVSLMLAARAIKESAGVADAAVVMGTEANKALLRQAGLLTREAAKASADDLVISVKAEKGGESILERADDFLAKKSVQSGEEGVSTPQSVREAKQRYPGANVAVISVAGAYAPREAREALAAGLHVLLFSDNVSMQDEIALKRFAVEEGLLMMGPGAGTAILNGIGLGFANAVPSGPVGIVSAAGTGLQEVSCLLAKGGVGISQAIGIGGRDFSARVGGLMAKAGLEALIADEATELIILISKPADATVTAKLVEKLQGGNKPAILCTLGAARKEKQEGSIYFTRTLEECAQTAIRLMGKDIPDYETYRKESSQNLIELAGKLRKDLSGSQKYIRGLYSGGTLCYEAQVIWAEMLSKPVYSNAPLDKEFTLPAGEGHPFHTAIDMGEEEYTVGRPHPMIDNDLRSRFIISAGQDASTAVIVLDVVLGFGVHPDPGAELASAVKQARKASQDAGRALHVVASITGTERDPQSLSGTEESLKQAGVIICSSNARAARLAGFLVNENTGKSEAA